MPERLQHENKTESQGNSSYTVLLHIINSINRAKEGQDSILTETVDFSEISRLSGKHGTDYYLYAYFKQYPSLIFPEHLQLLSDKIVHQAARSLMQLKELISLCSQLNMAGILYAIIKGPHLSNMLYGKSPVKTSYDLDILMVHPEDLFAFNRVFTHSGYNCMEQNILKGNWKQMLFILAKREIHYVNSVAGCAVDLHVRPFANTVLTRRLYENFFSNLEKIPFEGIIIPVLPVEKYFAYLCHHGACHQFNRLGWLLDIKSFYLQIRGTWDFRQIFTVAHSLHIGRSVCLALYMMELLFGIPAPRKSASDADHPAIIKRLAKKCLTAISGEKDETLSIKTRIRRIVYLVQLIEGFKGKLDVLLSLVLRHLALFFFRQGK